MFSKELTSVTPFSKLLALILFITLPIIAFILGMNYQKKIDYYKDYKMVTPITDIPVTPPQGYPTSIE